MNELINSNSINIVNVFFVFKLAKKNNFFYHSKSFIKIY